MDHSNILIAELIGHTKTVNSIEFMKEKNMIVSLSRDNTVRVWSLETFQCVSVIEGMSGYMKNQLVKLDEERCVVSEQFLMTVVDIAKAKIIKRMNHYVFVEPNKFVYLRDNVMLCGCRMAFCYLNIKNLSYSMKFYGVKDKLYDICKISDHELLTCSDNGTIKVWKY